MSAELAELNPHQKRRIRATCQYIDALLSQIETILNPGDSHSLFPRYAMDFAPSLRLRIEGGIAQIRARMSQAMAQHDIVVEPPSIAAAQAIRSALNFVDIAVTELRPRYMRGYGVMSAAVAAELDTAADELEQLVTRMAALVGSSQDPFDPPGEQR